MSANKPRRHRNKRATTPKQKDKTYALDAHVSIPAPDADKLPVDRNISESRPLTSGYSLGRELKGIGVVTGIVFLLLVVLMILL